MIAIPITEEGEYEIILKHEVIKGSHFKGRSKENISRSLNQFTMILTFGELVVTLLKMLMRTRKRVIRRAILPENFEVCHLGQIVETFDKLEIAPRTTNKDEDGDFLSLSLSLSLMTELTWYDIRRDEEGDPRNNNKEAGGEVIGDDVRHHMPLQDLTM